MRLTMETVVSGLLENFPELQPAYEWETRSGEDEGAYVIFDDVVYPHVEDLLSDASTEPSQALRRMFRFLEELASAEKDLRDVVAESIIEPLKADPTRMERARAVMGPSMRELAREWPPRQHASEAEGERGPQRVSARLLSPAGSSLIELRGKSIGEPHRNDMQ